MESKDRILIVSILFSIFLIAYPISAQTGGTYDLSHNVIAGGGSRSVGGQFAVEGTAGQDLAGTLSGGGVYRIRGGFWAFEALSPTAASVSISGRIRSSNKAGIRSVMLILTNAANGESRNAITNSFGHYRFDEITVGQTYILAAYSNRFAFKPNTLVITLIDELTDVDLYAFEVGDH